MTTLSEHEIPLLKKYVSSQMRFVITNSTIILGKNSNQIHLRDINPGQRVRVKHATFQTAIIPPQTTAFEVRIL